MSYSLRTRSPSKEVIEERIDVRLAIARCEKNVALCVHRRGILDAVGNRHGADAQDDEVRFWRTNINSLQRQLERLK